MGRTDIRRTPSSPAVPAAVLSAVLLAVNALFEHPPEALGLAGGVALVTGTVAAGWAVARRLLPPSDPWSSRAAAAGVFAALLVTLPALLLGHFGHLDPRLFLAVEAGLVVALAFLAPHSAPATNPESAPAGQGEGGYTPSPRWLRTARQAALLAGFAVAALLLPAHLHEDRYEPVHRLDDPSYHMITVAYWVQHEDLRMPRFTFGDRSTPYYPIDGEILSWALVAPLRDSDFLARWTQVPFLLGLLLATMAVARRLAASPVAAAVGALVLLTVARLYPDLTLSAANDVTAAFFAVAAVDALLAWGGRLAPGGALPRQRFDSVARPALYFGTALGLFLGTKYLALLLGAPLVLAAVLLPWLVRPSRLLPRSLRERLRSTGQPPAPSWSLPAHAGSLALAGTAAALAGGYTYLRNLVTTGNPVFPHPVHLGPWELPGWEHATLAARRHLPEFRIDVVDYLLDPTLAGELFRFTLLPAAILAPLVALLVPSLLRGGFRRDGDGLLPGRLLTALVLALPAVHFLLFVYQVHDHRDVRYLFAALALAAVGLAWLVDRVGRRWATGGEASAALLALGALAALVPGRLREHLGVLLLTLTACLLAGFVLARSARLLRRWTPASPSARLAATALFLLLACIGTAPTAVRHAEKKYDDHVVVDTLEAYAPDGAVVGVVGGNRWYELFGSRLQNRLVVVPRREPLEDRFYRWGENGTSYLADSSPRSFERWYWQVADSGAGYLVVHVEQGGRKEEQWLRSRPDRFELVTFFGDQELWRVRPPSAQ